MKTYLILSLIGFCSLHAAIAPSTSDGTAMVTLPKQDKELAWVDEQIQAILPARVGVADGLINSLIDPMKMAKRAPAATNGMKLLAPPTLGKTGILLPPKPVEEPLRLQAMVNKSVLISGKWYKVGDMVRNYTLAEIKPNSVLLTGKKRQKLILFLTKPNSNIQITTK
jgi:hypothetical protein